MKQYKVTLSYSVSIPVYVSAANEEEAVDKAYIEIGHSKYDESILQNLQEINDPNIELIN